MSIDSPQVEVSREPQAVASHETAASGFSWSSVTQALFFCSARLAFAAFLMFTSLYCLLVWVPFSNFSFIQNPPMGWIPAFVRLHALIYGVLLAAVAVTLIPDLRRKQTQTAAAAFLIVNAGAVIFLWREHALANLQPDITSYTWSMFSLLPLAWLAGLDLSRLDLSASGSLKDEGHRAIQTPNGFSLVRTTFAAVAVSVVFAATSFLRGTIQGVAPSAGLAASLCFHLVIFTMIGFVLALIRWASDTSPWPRVANFLLFRVLVWFLSMQLLRTMILPTISFEGGQATIFAAVVSLLAIVFVTGFVMKVRSMIPYASSWLARISVPMGIKIGAALALIATAAYTIPISLGPTDWDFVFQRLAVIVVWVFALWMIGWSGIRLRGQVASIVIFLVLAGAALGFARYAKLALYNADPSPTVQNVLDAYAGADISFKTAHDILSHPVDNQAYRQFYEFLKQNTNLGHDAVVGPADTRLVANLKPTTGTKPNVFLFVIDSLRQDYVSPYNHAVQYTPQIDQFAKDSVVLQNAFTRYGGTALSEPAIWVGAMQLHKQFIEPYPPMNNLQKLVETDGYQSYISTDPLLRTILAPSPSITGLDEGTNAWSDLDFVTTLKELETKIDSRHDRTKPIFAYSQPQNVHTLTMARSRIAGGRKAVSIYELGRIDTAFGEFLGFLRQRGLYENSIVILTADHGDSYGEYGRYGHSDFLFPEIIRIPMIVHLPPKIREQYVCDAKQPAFTTDITPTLFYLLGHRPILNNELFGRPLFTQTPQEALTYARSHYLIVSSYAPVYAVLGGQAQSLFIVDAVNSKNYFYNLIDDPAGSRSHLTPALQKENESLIRHDVSLIDDFYAWHPPQN